MTNIIGLTLCIQPVNVNNTHTVIHAVRSCIRASMTPFIIVKVSLCYWNWVSRLLDSDALSDCIGWQKPALLIPTLKWETCRPPTCSLFRQSRSHISLSNVPNCSFNSRILMSLQRFLFIFQRIKWIQKCNLSAADL